MSAIFDLSIEAAVELEQLRFCTAKRLAQDALGLAEAFAGQDDVIAVLPASLVAQVLYEQGYLDEAEGVIRDHLPAVKVGGTIESALRAYFVLVRIAAHRGKATSLPCFYERPRP